MEFKKAVKEDAKLRCALAGPPGSGKTYTALKIATELGGPIAVVDTEHGSASKYADEFAFDVLELDSFHPQKYLDAIAIAQKHGYKVIILDSLSHAWAGKDGSLELVDRAAAKTKSKNTWAAWRGVTPIQNALIDGIIAADLHVIATLRTKMEHVQEKDEKGNTVIRKVGMQPIQREGVEYEFDVVGDLDSDNKLIISKTRCSALQGGIFDKPGKDVADILKGWLKGVVRTTDNGKAQAPPHAAPKPDAAKPSHDPTPANGDAQVKALRAAIKKQTLRIGKKGALGKAAVAMLLAHAKEYGWEYDPETTDVDKLPVEHLRDLLPRLTAIGTASPAPEDAPASTSEPTDAQIGQWRLDVKVQLDLMTGPSAKVKCFKDGRDAMGWIEADVAFQLGQEAKVMRITEIPTQCLEPILSKLKEHMENVKALGPDEKK